MNILQTIWHSTIIGPKSYLRCLKEVAAMNGDEHDENLLYTVGYCSKTNTFVPVANQPEYIAELDKF